MSESMSRGELIEEIYSRVENNELEALSNSSLRQIMWQFMLLDDARDNRAASRVPLSEGKEP